MDDNRQTDWDRRCPRKEDSTQNPYYNQPTHNPYKKEGFAIASMVSGILSMLSVCTVVGPVICIAFCILFAVLASRKGKRMSNFVVYGLLASMLGFISTVSTLLKIFFMK